MSYLTLYFYTKTTKNISEKACGEVQLVSCRGTLRLPRVVPGLARMRNPGEHYVQSSCSRLQSRGLMTEKLSSVIRRQFLIQPLNYFLNHLSYLPLVAY